MLHEFEYLFVDVDIINEWKGNHNGGSRATAIWLKPDACCGDKPYNSGEKVNFIKKNNIFCKNLKTRCISFTIFCKIFQKFIYETGAFLTKFWKNGKRDFFQKIVIKSGALTLPLYTK